MRETGRRFPGGWPVLSVSVHVTRGGSDCASDAGAPLSATGCGERLGNVGLLLQTAVGTPGRDSASRSIGAKRKATAPLAVASLSPGPATQIRTGDTWIFSPVLYQLSYPGTSVPPRPRALATTRDGLMGGMRVGGAARGAVDLVRGACRGHLTATPDPAGSARARTEAAS
jgi:hypothetical protein